MLPNTILLDLHYLPCIQYLSKFLLHEQVLIEQAEHYVKGSYRNRCHIASANGLLRLSIPLVKGKNEQQAIREVRIASGNLWQTQHWQAIRSAYGKSPYFEHYADVIEPLYRKEFTFLFDWNLALLQCLLSLLSLPLSFELTKQFEHQPNPQRISDFRNAIGPKKRNQREDASFMAKPYPQVFEEKSGFLPNLSALDLLFCTGPQAIVLIEDSIIPTYDQ